jgi:hypothetical protein
MRTLSYLPLLSSLICLFAQAQAAETWRSYPPMRSLPTPTHRPRASGPAYFVDPVRGEDGQQGSEAKPFKSFTHALGRLKPGDTLYLRGGIYREPVTLELAGLKGKPITIRSFPGELAILDGGIAEFAEKPARAWEPFLEGAEGEFRSVKSYPRLGEKVMGNFLDSMIPLHGYRNLIDLRSRNEYWNLGNKLNTDKGIYCGPGVWYDRESGHIHVRLAHTTLPVLGEDHYGPGPGRNPHGLGETDPRKLPLLVAGSRTVLGLTNCKHLRLQDLVVRGSSRSTVHCSGCEHIDLDGLTIYGGSPALLIQNTSHLRLIRSALHSIAAPWHFRSSHKYRGSAAYLLTVRGSDPPCRDFEIAYCELTDGHDGPFVGTVLGLKFHHNLVDNFNDDGIYLMAMGTGGDVHIYQNILSRCLTTFSFAGNHPVGKGVFIYRNVIDLRRPVPYFQPSGPDDTRFRTPEGGWRYPSFGRVASDHGGPTWEPIRFYHNTVILAESAWRGYYGGSWGGHTHGTQRWVFNNVFVHLKGMPGLTFASADDFVQADHNLHWGVQEGPAFKRDFFARFRRSTTFAKSKRHYPPGWASHDLFADPLLTRLVADWKKPVDVRPKPGSPVVDAGLPLPADWPDPLSKADRNQPDLGALPLGAEPLRVGPLSMTR